MYNVSPTVDFDQVHLCNSSNKFRVFHSAFIGLLEGYTEVKELGHKPSINVFSSRLEFLKASLSWKLQTSKYAERTGNWDTHLYTDEQILRFLVSSNNYLYAKSYRIHLKKMTDLKETNPEVFNEFEDGNSVMRLSDKFYADLSADLS